MYLCVDTSIKQSFTCLRIWNMYAELYYFIFERTQWKIVNSVCTHTSIFQYFTVVRNCDHRGWCLREWSPCLKNLEVFIVLRKQMNYTDRLRFIDDLLSYGRDEMWREQKKRMLSSHNILQCYTEDCSRVV